MMRRAFDELGYRRYEWKCDSLNAPSRRAAERLGFSFEGIFRQALVYKGRNRDTAWFSILDREWPALRGAYEAVAVARELRRQRPPASAAGRSDRARARRSRRGVVTDAGHGSRVTDRHGHRRATDGHGQTRTFLQHGSEGEGSLASADLRTRTEPRDAGAADAAAAREGDAGRGRRAPGRDAGAACAAAVRRALVADPALRGGRSGQGHRSARHRPRHADARHVAPRVAQGLPCVPRR